jgi:acid phosphatase
VTKGDCTRDLPGISHEEVNALRYDRGKAGRSAAPLRRTLAGALVAAGLFGILAAADAANCPPLRQPRIGPTETPLNIDEVKKQLRDYQAGDYEDEVAAVLADARAYVEERAGQVTHPAVVLDIDETSLSNWANLSANDFGFIPNGPCDRLPEGACGFNEWVLKSTASPIMPTLNFFDAAVAKGVSVFFITGRRDNQRQATLSNLDRAGYQGWTKLITRPDGDSGSLQAFKTRERAKIEAAGYNIIANIGDQMSDLGDVAECKFKVPNPFYLIP